MSHFTIVEKKDGWSERLEAYVVRMTRIEFIYGQFDCALFADGCFEAQTKESFASDFKGRYSSLEDGLRLLRDAGFEDHVAFVAAKLPEMPVSLAQKGDLAVVDFGDAGKTLTVVGGHRLHGPMPGMRGTLPLTSAVRAFAIGRQPDL